MTKSFEEQVLELKQKCNRNASFRAINGVMMARYTINNNELENDLYLGTGENKENPQYIFRIPAHSFSIDDFMPSDEKRFNRPQKINNAKRDIAINLGNFKELYNETNPVDFSKYLWKKIDYQNKKIIDNPNFEEKTSIKKFYNENHSTQNIQPTPFTEENIKRTENQDVFYDEVENIKELCDRNASFCARNGVTMARYTINNNELENDLYLGTGENKENPQYIFRIPAHSFSIDDFMPSDEKRFNRPQKINNAKRDIAINLGNFKELYNETNPVDFSKYLWKKIDYQNKKIINNHNYSNEFLTKKDYKDNRDSLFEKLNEEQKQVAETNSKATLVVAGAGCGKTHTLMGRLIYLYKTGKIKSAKDVLLVVFNQQNRRDLKKKLTNLFEEDFSASAHTFHSLGLNIIKKIDGREVNCFDPELPPLDEILKLFEARENVYQNDFNNKYNATLRNIFNDIKNIKEVNNWEDNLILWGNFRVGETGQTKYIAQLYANYVPNDITQCKNIAMLEEANLSLDTQNYRFSDYSLTKIRLLNYLILNGYEARDIIVQHDEKRIQIKTENNKFLYWEKLGLDEGFEEVEKYITKRKSLSEDQIHDFIHSALMRSISSSFRNVASLFITLCKIYQIYKKDDAEKNIDFEYLKSYILGRIAPDDIKSKNHVEIFFKLISPIYKIYQEFLNKSKPKFIDFNDMINDAISALNIHANDKECDSKFKYKYILVDEYQDIAEDNFNLIKTLRDRNDSSVMCVGDDWQSIYSWRGSNLKFFNKMAEYFGIERNKFKELKIQETFRYGQTLADISGKFIMKNKEQRKKHIKAHADETQLIHFNSKNGWDKLLESIKNRYGACGAKNKTVFVLCRYHRDCYNILGKAKEQIEKELHQLFSSESKVVTIHTSKGSEADVVVILNLISGEFPSQTKDDIVLKYLKEKYNYFEEEPYAEERRLMYVAMTRAIDACYLWIPQVGKSEFLKEIEVRQEE